MRFRITTIFWVFALLASAMATFGPAGIVIAAFVVGFWVCALTRSLTFLINLLFFCALLGFLFVLLLPAVQSSREVSRISHCQNNLRQIACALQNYHDKHGTFPPAFIADKNGKPMHSWRMLLLPYFGAKSLYGRYNFDEPWNGPNNQSVTTSPFDIYECPSDPPLSPTNPQANYFAVKGPHTMWPNNGMRKLEHVTDGLDRTILFIEAAGRDVAWADPVDLEFDEAVAFLSSGANSEVVHSRWMSRPGFFYKLFNKSATGINVAFADGSVGFLPIPIPRELAVALLTVNGGEEIDMSQLESVLYQQLDYARIYSFSIFLLLSLMPAFKLWQPPKTFAENDTTVTA